MFAPILVRTAILALLCMPRSSFALFPGSFFGRQTQIDTELPEILPLEIIANLGLVNATVPDIKSYLHYFHVAIDHWERDYVVMFYGPWCLYCK